MQEGSSAGPYYEAIQAKVDIFAEEIFCKEPKEAMVAYQVLDDLKEGKYDAEVVNAIFQNPNTRYSVADAFYFAKVYAGILSGDILTTCIHIGEEPSGDEEFIENKEKLKNIEEPFEITVNPADGSGYNSDGTLKWNESIHLHQFSPTDPYEKNNCRTL